ncbi:hypothetical protein A2W13_03215 [Candidatus Woesebacteria bacterium RBG_16_36_11]|uniref:HIT domain-containing protein n=3 Tax=Candidatus Woeseibacteriota TaxID=1752722 RepID=A0A1F7XBR5_9BACT|nr:MAG: hypothetical protein A2Z67_00295 [Candidatus Woesebacteria bacterium RBG_13_36_22]OGM12467.1 MAG: hypothetical protein A2W13_03215 [Candidatus Woesebacteria bacterium RBG_16_36_11]OGM17348.1 MAG: hypothetical protein A2V55_00070 [Candidatus Woesebacteria bacterium RBG_19FT_COMBO_37_29]
MNDCVFCKIVKGEIKTDFEEETDDLVVFKDKNPKAPIHFLIVTKRHIQDIKSDKGNLWTAIGKLSIVIADKLSIQGFRLVHNAGDAASVKHMHVHFLGQVSEDREI